MSLSAEIKQTVSLVAEIEASGVTWDRHQSAPRRGEWWASCPLHGEATASFHVTERGGKGGVFHCFGCGAKGSVIDFVMARDGTSFTDAIRKLGSDVARKPNLAPLAAIPTPCRRFPPMTIFDMTGDPYSTALGPTCVRAIRDHCDFTINTFGPGERLAGTLAHLREELAEVEAAPHDLEEWVDLILLAINGATRHGHGPDAIMDGIADKVAKNLRRTWPDWRGVPEGDPIKHVRGSHD